ncbi:FecR domain-containing protein [Agriterribacter sp.]|uniref:FecR family protein n=1 Tax=Agriterribacter sp. TaxID=2821509 RepID=UPI002C53840F|nr:FecR domain-containing protein [Agriterribacter sp.]HRO47138.1 FecR domain-containing protein [Agriterribacter sp.]HRQ17912.1 FecR domain-containing protein [Agriterribacter sp.]
MPIPQHIQRLIGKYLAGEISREESAILDEWYLSFNDHEVEITATDNLNEEVIKNRIHKRLLEDILQKQALQVTKSRRRRYIPAAAAALIILGLSYFFFFNSGKPGFAPTGITSTTSPNNDIAPGGNKAVLILANGSSIPLDSISNGIISKQGNIDVNKTANGLLSYSINSKDITGDNAELYNTIATPRGGQYQVTLSDGTKVWLNAGSSIHFPVAFAGNERKVEITGEAYFEVVKDETKPFKVLTASSAVEVLGTHFNVNAYDDEASVKTTLLEGKVTVSGKNEIPHLLAPGQQSSVSKEGEISVTGDVNIEDVIAWKNGRFQYTSVDLKSILRQISRWYNVDIEYRGDVNLDFTGQLPRSATVSKVFEKLEMTGEVHFRIEGRKIIVSP